MQVDTRSREELSAAYDATIAVRDELLRAVGMYPWWPSNIVMQAAIAAEESGEVVKAVNNYFWKHGEESVADIRKEAVQAAAMWLRFIVNLDENAARTSAGGTEPRL